MHPAANATLARPALVEVNVARWVRHDGSALHVVLESMSPTLPCRLHRGTLVLDRGFEPCAPPRCTWRATGRLIGVGFRLIRFARVEAEVTVYPNRAEVVVRPISTRVARWAPRRQARYFSLAHDAADVLASLITPAGAVSPPAHAAQQGDVTREDSSPR